MEIKKKSELLGDDSILLWSESWRRAPGVLSKWNCIPFVKADRRKQYGACALNPFFPISGLGKHKRNINGEYY